MHLIDCKYLIILFDYISFKYCFWWSLFMQVQSTIGTIAMDRMKQEIIKKRKTTTIEDVAGESADDVSSNTLVPVSSSSAAPLPLLPPQNKTIKGSIEVSQTSSGASRLTFTITPTPQGGFNLQPVGCFTPETTSKTVDTVAETVDTVAETVDTVAKTVDTVAETAVEAAVPTTPVIRANSYSSTETLQQQSSSSECSSGPTTPSAASAAVSDDSILYGIDPMQYLSTNVTDLNNLWVMCIDVYLINPLV